MIGMFVILFVLPWNGSAADLLEKVIKPSKNYDQIVNIWNNREAVGNEIFREGTAVDTISELNCFKPMPKSTPDLCQNNGGVWLAKTWNQCYERIPISVQWKNLAEWETNCPGVWWERIFAVWVTVTEKEPLIVRLTKRLLRLTIAISITMIILIGIKLIWSWVTGQGLTEWIKNVTNLVIWLILALSSVSIIWLIQSFTINSLSGAPANLDEVTQPLNP